MKEKTIMFKCFNYRQLGICLKLLYLQNLDFTVKVEEDEKSRIIYSVSTIVDEDKADMVEHAYLIMV